MKRKNIKGIFSMPMQIDGDPIIENKQLPVMGDIPQKKEGQINNPPKGTGTMGGRLTENSKGNKKAIVAGFEMAPFNAKENRKVKMPIPKQGYEEQVTKVSRSKAGAGYIILRMRVQDGALMVLGGSKIEGPLLINENLLQNGLAYEVFLNERRIALGSVADYGEQRSFARPDKDHNHEGHFIAVLPSFEFNVKISLESLALKDLPNIELTLYRFKENIPEVQISDRRLQEQFGKELRVVAAMHGIEPERLQKGIKENLKRIFK
ncbi:MAG: hypothetical protein ABIY51_13875 [Ferruginibacter sp.]